MARKLWLCLDETGMEALRLLKPRLAVCTAHHGQCHWLISACEISIEIRTKRRMSHVGSSLSHTKASESS
jgi:hypothetical protein